MKLFYDSLPLPLFFVITFIIPVYIFIYFYRKKKEYPNSTIFLLGIIFLCLIGISTGVMRVFIEYGLFIKYDEWFGAIPIPFIILAVPFILTAEYQKVKHDNIKRKRILLISLGLLLIFIYILMLTIFKLSQL